MTNSRYITSLLALLVLGAGSASAQSHTPDPNRLAKPPGWYFPRSTYSAKGTVRIAKPGWYTPKGAATADMTRFRTGWFAPQATATSESTRGYNYQGSNRLGWHMSDLDASDRANALALKMGHSKGATAEVTTSSLSRTSKSAAPDPTLAKRSTAPPPLTSTVGKPKYYFEKWNPRAVPFEGMSRNPIAKRSRSKPGYYPYTSLRQGGVGHHSRHGMGPSLMAQTESASSKSSGSALLPANRSSNSSSQRSIGGR